MVCVYVACVGGEVRGPLTSKQTDCSGYAKSEEIATDLHTYSADLISGGSDQVRGKEQNGYSVVSNVWHRDKVAPEEAEGTKPSGPSCTSVHVSGMCAERAL